MSYLHCCLSTSGMLLGQHFYRQMYNRRAACGLWWWYRLYRLPTRAAAVANLYACIVQRRAAVVK